MSTVSCPLCPWTYAIPPLPAGVDTGTLASVFGPGIMLQHAKNRQAEETEERLREHFRGHKLEEWVAKVTELQRANNALRQQLQVTQAVLDGAHL